jgi:antitoxin (DNA-binding transcriptional repressor) of toxin-antitoxin stability system
MKDLSVSEFKARLSQYLRDVKSGETLIITEYKQPVAEVRGVGTEADILIPASRPFSLDGSRPNNPVSGLAMELLCEDRGER